MRTRTCNESRHVLCWIFRRGNYLLTWKLTRVAQAGKYVLSLVPNWDKAHGSIETFESGLGALHRHATIAAALRESGWKVVAYTGPSPFTPDYQSVLDSRAA